ncbi:MAG TPA: ferritin-like domain-containing protein [Roseiflexaceae bacterium]|nr:ferritin-like domain-containing protein [Roseiflexaceae bacterium]
MPSGHLPKVFFFLVHYGSISHIGHIQTLEDDDDDFVPPREMIERLIADNRHIASAMRAAMELRDEKRDHPTSNLLQELLDETEKRIWFLYEVSQGSENTD